MQWGLRQAVVVFGLLGGLLLAAAEARASAATDLALADELLGAVQAKLGQEEAKFAQRGDPRGVFASVYGDVMTAGIRQAIKQTPGKFNAPLEEAIASLAFLPLYAEVNRKIEATLPELQPGQRISRDQLARLRTAGVPSHWIAYLKFTQDPKRQNETGGALAGIMAHVLGDLKEVVRADLHAIAGDPTKLNDLLTRALPDATDAALRTRVLQRVRVGSGYRNAAAFHQDFDVLNALISDKTRDTFRDIAQKATEQGSPDFLAEAGYRAMRGVGPVGFSLPVKLASFALFTTWRGKAFQAGQALWGHDGANDARSIARRTAESETSAVRRIRFTSAASRIAEHPVARPPLWVAAQVLGAWRRAGDPSPPPAARSIAATRARAPRARR